MNRGSLSCVALAVAVVTTCTCGGNKNSSPTAPLVATLSAAPSAKLRAPSDGATIPYLQQPLTFAYEDPAPIEGRALVSETLEVASDRDFTRDLYTQPAPKGGTGTNSALLAAKRLSAGTYFWRIRTSAENSTTGVSPTWTFTIGAEPTVELPPVEVGSGFVYSMANGHRDIQQVYPARSPWPRLEAFEELPDLAATTGISIEFQVSLDPGFGELWEAGTANANAPFGACLRGYECYVSTSFLVSRRLEMGRTYWWRIRAIKSATHSASRWTVASYDTQPIETSLWQLALRTCKFGLYATGALDSSGGVPTFRGPEGLTLQLGDPQLAQSWWRGKMRRNVQSYAATPCATPSSCGAENVPTVWTRGDDGGYIGTVNVATMKFRDYFEDWGPCVAGNYAWALIPPGGR